MKKNRNEKNAGAAGILAIPSGYAINANPGPKINMLFTENNLRDYL